MQSRLCMPFRKNAIKIMTGLTSTATIVSGLYLILKDGHFLNDEYEHYLLTKIIVDGVVIGAWTFISGFIGFAIGYGCHMTDAMALKQDEEERLKEIELITDAPIEAGSPALAPIQLDDLKRTYQGAHPSLWDSKTNEDERIEIIPDRSNDGVYLPKFLGQR